MAPVSTSEHRLKGKLIMSVIVIQFILGTGERLFPTGGEPAYLQCLSAERSGAAVLTRYGRAAR